MASNTVEGYTKEFGEAIAALESPIRGLKDRLQVSLSEPTLEAVRRQLVNHNLRHGLIVTARDILGDFEVALEALLKDGYPDMPNAEVSVAIFEELQGQRRDEEAADEKFDAVSPAAKIVFGPATIEPKPK